MEFDDEAGVAVNTANMGNQEAETMLGKGRMSQLFGFFFGEKSLMKMTIGVKIYEAVRFTDMIYMILMVQTHPYFKGVWLSRIQTLLTVGVAAIGAYFIATCFILKRVTEENSTKVLSIVSLVSIVVYPITSTVVNFFFYNQVYTISIVYGLGELIKMTLYFTVQDGLREFIDLRTTKQMEERMTAMGYYVGDICKIVLFGVFGTLITYLMKNPLVQQMLPYNYFFAFLILTIPLIGSFFLIRAAKKEKN